MITGFFFIIISVYLILVGMFQVSGAIFENPAPHVISQEEWKKFLDYNPTQNEHDSPVDEFCEFVVSLLARLLKL
jgi:hypothetical protein